MNGFVEVVDALSAGPQDLGQPTGASFAFIFESKVKY